MQNRIMKHFVLVLSGLCLISAERYCFRMELASIRIGVNSKRLFINLTIVSKTLVKAYMELDTFENPTLTLDITRWGIGRPKEQLFKTTNRLCEMTRFIKVNPFFGAFMEAALKLSNVTVACPLPAGKYYAEVDSKMLKKIFPLRLLHKPNTYISFHSRFYDQKPKANITFMGESLPSLINAYYWPAYKIL